MPNLVALLISSALIAGFPLEPLLAAAEPPKPSDVNADRAPSSGTTAALSGPASTGTMALSTAPSTGTTAAPSTAPSPAPQPPPATPPARPPRSAVLIVGFENTSEDRSLYWVGEAIADGLAREVRLAGGEAIDRRERLAVRDEMGVPTLSTLTLASQIHIAEELGAPALVTGSFSATGEILIVRARVVTIGTARTGPWLTVTGSVKSIIALQKQLFAKIRSSLPPPRRAPSPSGIAAEDGVPQAAYELVLKTYLEDASDKRERMLRRALELAPDYLRAKMELAQIYRESNNLGKAADTLSTIATRDPGLASEGETLLAEIHLEMGRQVEAEAAIRRALSVRETARAHLVLAKLAAARGDRALATTEARRSRALDPSDPEILEVEESLSKMP